MPCVCCLCGSITNWRIYKTSCHVYIYIVRLVKSKSSHGRIFIFASARHIKFSHILCGLHDYIGIATMSSNVLSRIIDNFGKSIFENRFDFDWHLTSGSSIVLSILVWVSSKTAIRLHLKQINFSGIFFFFETTEHSRLRPLRSCKYDFSK